MNIKVMAMGKLWIYSIIFIVCFLVLGCASENSKKEKAVEFIQVKSEDMINDYIRDQGTAESKYKNKNIKLTGNVLRKGQFKNGTDFFVVTNSKYAAGRQYSILVQYPVDRVDDVNKLKYGDFLVAEGACVGIVPQDEPTDVSIQIQVGKQVKRGIEKSVPDKVVEEIKTDNENEEKVIQGTIKGTDVRMRSSAGLNSKILGYFNNGEIVTVLEIHEGWYKISRSNGQEGWVSSDFCKI